MSSLMPDGTRRFRGAAEEFASVPRRYYDPSFKTHAVKVLPGEHYVTQRDDEMVVTVLGSCVAACIRDPLVGVGGLNHFMLPGERHGHLTGEASRYNEMRYGHFAMEKLLNDVLSHGGLRERLEVKLFGGASMMASTIRIGDDNAEFAKEFVQKERLKLVSSDLGGEHGRRIHYFPKTGQVMRLLLRRDPDKHIFNEELSYRDRLSRQRTEGSVELFE